MSIKFSSIPQKRLLQGITSASTTFYINNILSFDGINNVLSTDLGTQHYIAFRNDTGTILELMEIDPATISTGPITILKRGLSFYGDRTTETAALKLDWPTNTIVMFGTDVPQIFQYLKEYIDAAAIAGSVPASTSAAGIVVEASQAEVDAGTITKTIAAVAYKLFAPLDKIRAKKYHDYAADSVGTDAYAITITPAITAYSTGQRFTFKVATANTGACTLNVSGLGAKTIKKSVSVDLETGDILANQIVEVEYDGTNMQLLSRNNFTVPNVVTTFMPLSRGNESSQFDITLTGGTTYRYTWDGGGGDPLISAATFPTGSRIYVNLSNGSAGNIGTFTVTGSGTNYFEVTNASGVAENNKQTGFDGALYLLQTTTTYTKNVNTKFAIIEVVGGGGKGLGNGAGGGGGGGYARKLVASSLLAATETVTVGAPGATTSMTITGASTIQATAGANAVDTRGGTPGVGSNGDVNVKGQAGGTSGGDDTGGGGTDNRDGGNGGSSVLGGGGRGGVNNNNDAEQGGLFGGGGGGGSDPSTSIGQIGAPGCVIITEYFN